MERAVRQGLEKAVGRPGAARDGAAAAVEEAEVDAELGAQLGDALLGAVQVPLRGEDAAILAGVAVAEHDLLLRPRAPAGLQRERAARHRVREPGAQDVGRALEVGDGLEQRHHLDLAGEALARGAVGDPAHQADLAQEHVDGQQV